MEAFNQKELVPNYTLVQPLTEAPEGPQKDFATLTAPAVLQKPLVGWRSGGNADAPNRLEST